MGGSRDPGTNRPRRARPRPSARKPNLLSLSRVLTDRDRRLLEDLFDHRVLTVHQIEEMYFTSGPVTRRRMLRLARLGVVRRFHPPALGSAPYHYVLATLGARVVAAQRAVEFKDLRFREENVEELPHRPEREHLVETNGFFSRLIRACRDDGSFRVAEWWGERRCRHRWGEIVFPDAYGRLHGPQGGVSFFLEYDRGTERPWRLAAKLVAYARIGLGSDRPDALVFCFPDPIRETSARRRLHGVQGLVVATASWDRVGPDPLGVVWLPTGSERRLRLVDLAEPAHAFEARYGGGGR
jgi:hypothetical protein